MMRMKSIYIFFFLLNTLWFSNEKTSGSILIVDSTHNNLKKSDLNGPRVTTTNGIIEGVYEGSKDLRSFKGIPFAEPPVGELRFREPMPVQNWKGIKMTTHFGPKAMQLPKFSDMRFRSNGTSEDCLYLNVWTPAKSSNERLPVLVYFYGGGFVGGDGSEYRYDGASMAKKGIVTLTVNYRLGVFSLLALHDLSIESKHHASGNYGLLDQNAALRWVKENISAFGGDPHKVTIAGESAGSISVCAQMVSPLSKNLIAGAIGESGALFKPTLPPIPLVEAEKIGATFMTLIGAHSIIELRTIPAEKLIEMADKTGLRMPPNIDGYFLTDLPEKTFEAGKQAHVPLLVGWNTEESDYKPIIKDSLTPLNYERALKKLYNAKAAEALKLYPGSTEKEIFNSATDLAGDRFIVYGTWKWAELHKTTSNQPVYRYLFSRIRRTAADRGKALPLGSGAPHSSEIEYALGNLETNHVYDWTNDDLKVSNLMEDYFANFIKTGNPNGDKLPKWEPLTRDGVPRFLNIDVKTEMKPALNEARYHFLEKCYNP